MKIRLIVYIMEHKTLTRRGYILLKSELTENEKKMVLKDLTVTPVVLQAYQMGAAPRKFPIYLESEKRYFVPRFYGIKMFGPPVSSNITEGLPINIKVDYNLLTHQQTAYNKTIDVLTSKGGGILSLYCGGGKTFIAIKTIEYIKRKTLVIVNKEYLMDQWAESIRKFAPTARIGFLQQDKILTENVDIVIAMLHSLVLRKTEYDSNIFTEFGYVIMDECHHIASETFSKALPKVATTYNLGLSATPYRKDGLTYVFEYYIGNIHHVQKREGWNNVQVKQIVCSSSAQAYETLMLKSGTKDTIKMLTNLTEYEPRNKLVYTLLKVLVQMHRKILVLSLRREHLQTIARLLEDNPIMLDNKQSTYGFYYGRQQMNKKNYKNMLNDSVECNVILGTNAMASEGLDIEKLNTVIFLLSTTDIEQASGRILRKFNPTIHPIIVDITDKCGNFPKHFNLRKKHYVEEEYHIQSYNINFDKIDFTKVEKDLTTFLGEKNVKPEELDLTNTITSKTCVPIIKSGECLLDDD